MDKAAIVEIIWWVLIAYTTFIRMKYVWMGTKVRREKSCKDVSTKAILHTHIEYWIMFAHNLNISDTKDQFFWAFGIFTTMFTVVQLFRFREDQSDGLRTWIWKGLRGKLRNEGGILR